VPKSETKSRFSSSVSSPKTIWDSGEGYAIQSMPPGQEEQTGLEQILFYLDTVRMADDHSAMATNPLGTQMHNDYYIRFLVGGSTDSARRFFPVAA